MVQCESNCVLQYGPVCGVPSTVRGTSRRAHLCTFKKETHALCNMFHKRGLAFVALQQT